MAAKQPESKEKDEGDEVAEKPKSKKKLIIIIAVVLILIGAGVPLAFMGGGDKSGDGHGEEDQHEEEKHYATAKLDTFIVNLSENTTFLKVTILLEYDPSIIEAAEKLQGGAGGHGAGGSAPAADALPPLFEKRKPMIHDAIIRVLSSKKSSEVLTPDGKEQLKQDLIEVINEAIGLDEGPVVNIYFTEFIIQ